MEIPSFGVRKKHERRSGKERRPDERAKQTRRTRDERRGDTLARSIVHTLDVLRLHKLAGWARNLAEKNLLGPAFMLCSAMVSFIAYSAIIGVREGAILVGALLVHEFGHFLFVLKQGYRPHWWWFVPLLGAMMRLPDMKSRSDEAWIAIGGPLVGTIGAVIAVLFWQYGGLEGDVRALVYEFALVSTLLNLFNLTPISPLDGGRVTQASHIAFQWFGFVALLFFSWFFDHPSLLLVWMLVATERFLAYPAWRFGCALTLFAAMNVLMFLGYDTKTSMIEDVAYVAFGILLVVLARPTDISPVEREHHDLAPFPELKPRQRLLWGLTWMFFTGVLLVLLGVLVGAF